MPSERPALTTQLHEGMTPVLPRLNNEACAVRVAEERAAVTRVQWCGGIRVVTLQYRAARYGTAMATGDKGMENPQQENDGVCVKVQTASSGACRAAVRQTVLSEHPTYSGSQTVWLVIPQPLCTSLSSPESPPLLFSRL